MTLFKGNMDSAQSNWKTGVKTSLLNSVIIHICSFAIDQLVTQHKHVNWSNILS